MLGSAWFQCRIHRHNTHLTLTLSCLFITLTLSVSSVLQTQHSPYIDTVLSVHHTKTVLSVSSVLQTQHSTYIYKIYCYKVLIFQPCNCQSGSSISQQCDLYTGRCRCLPDFNGDKCDSCLFGFYQYPTCLLPYDHNHHSSAKHINVLISLKLVYFLVLYKQHKIYIKFLSLSKQSELWFSSIRGTKCNINYLSEFEPWSGEVYTIQHYMIKFISDLWHIYIKFTVTKF
jgi:hypothetical protein